MKGYYTVKLVGGELPPADRIALETRYVAALESALGGAHQVRDECLAAAALARQGSSQPALTPHLQQACELAELRAWEARTRVQGARFSLSAWSAADLV